MSTDGPKPANPNAGADFLSGDSGQVFGIRATSRAVLKDAAADALAGIQRRQPRLRRAAADLPRRQVLVLAIERRDVPNVLAAAGRELLRSRHAVQIARTEAGTRGKFENLNALLAANPPTAKDWLLVLDDDVALPSGFLDAFLFLAERFDLRLAQPAHRHRSHAAWRVTRRGFATVVRETAFVEIGPLTAFHASTFSTLLPFPSLKFGWGLDSHWSALARDRGWKLGVVDGTPVRHGLRRIASSYDRGDAVTEARSFLAGRPYTTAAEAQRPLSVHRGWGGRWDRGR
jgi:hypothetical protein